MKRAILIDHARRRYAKSLIDLAPPGSVVTVTDGPNRTLEQNAKFWAMIEDLRKHYAAMSPPRAYTKEQMRTAVMHAAGWQVEFVTGLDGQPFPAGYHSSTLTISQMSDLIEWMYAHGAENGVVWKERERTDGSVQAD